MEHHREEIKQRTEELSGANPGHRKYIVFYSTALGEIMEELSEEQRERYMKEAMERQMGTLTVEEQCR